MSGLIVNGVVVTDTELVRLKQIAARAREARDTAREKVRRAEAGLDAAELAVIAARERLRIYQDTRAHWAELKAEAAKAREATE